MYISNTSINENYSKIIDYKAKSDFKNILLRISVYGDFSALHKDMEELNMLKYFLVKSFRNVINFDIGKVLPQIIQWFVF